MTQIKLTKNELRDQERKRDQLMRYLPTLQLKKALLQTEVDMADSQLETAQNEVSAAKQKIANSQKLLSHPSAYLLDNYTKIVDVKTHLENIAGVEVPNFDQVEFTEADYHLFDTPFWFDQLLADMRALLAKLEEVKVIERKKALLEKELRDVSIRVNLFEKVLIPRCDANIKKIKIFLGDQQLSAVAQAKVAKTKIELRKKEVA